MINRLFFENYNTQNLEDCVKTFGQAQLFFYDHDQSICGYRNPNLGFYCIGSGSEKTFDPEILFDPPEEYLDSPTATVKKSDGFGWNIGSSRGQIL